MPRSLAAAILVTIVAMLAPRAAHAQFIPEAGPSQEEQEFASTIFLGPEATVLGGFLGGGAVYAVERNCCTKKGDDPAVVPVAIGAGIGAAIGASWAQWSISSHYHPGNRFMAAVGATVGAAAGSAVYFGGPPHQNSNEQVLRVVTFLLAPSLAAYGGWHVGNEGGDFYDAAPRPAWSDHLWSERARSDAAVQTISIRF